MTAGDITIVVLAHNEERRISACLDSLPLRDPAVAIHVVVNGPRDKTADIVRTYARRWPQISLHEYAQGGKSRSWNRITLDEFESYTDTVIFVDGDAEVMPGSIKALVAAVHSSDRTNAASALPMNGRNYRKYQSSLVRESGIFGDLYALSGNFLRRMKNAAIRLPEDLVGDDGLISSLAKTDLLDESHYDVRGVAVCSGAGFVCEPVNLLSVKSLKLQYRRMVNYSVRHYQNRIISDIMRTDGPAALPEHLSSLYGSVATEIFRAAHAYDMVV